MRLYRAHTRRLLILVLHSECAEFASPSVRSVLAASLRRDPRMARGCRSRLRLSEGSPPFTSLVAKASPVRGLILPLGRAPKHGQFVVSGS